MSRNASIPVLFFAAVFALAAFGSTVPAPDTVTACTNPQPLGNMVGLGGNQVSARQGIVWNGQEYVAAYSQWSSPTLLLQKVFADGLPDGPAVAVPGLSSYAYSLFPVSLAFDGTNYAVAYVAGGTGGYWEAFFAKLGPAFNLLAGPTQVSFYGATATTQAYWPQVAAAGNGSGYCVAWYDNRSGHTQIYATQLDATGAVVNGGAAHDLLLSSTSYAQGYPSVGWSAYGANGGGGFVVAWQDYRTNAHFDIWCALIYGNGSVGYVNGAVQPPTGSATSPHLATAPGYLGLAWSDTRNGNPDIYFQVLNGLGYPSGSALQLTSNASSQAAPYACWNGAEFGAFWADSRAPSGQSEVWFQRVSAGGALLGGNVQATLGMNAIWPAAAFGRLGYLVVGDAANTQNYAEPFGCNYAYQPGCPAGMVAYGITGTSATLSWLPAFDQYTDLAYYQVYRNSQPVAKTAGTFYTDTGLSLNATYSYSVLAVNAADLPSSGCGTANSVYVKTNATLLLAVNKQNPDALLSWTDSQPLNSYNVFRGTSPQVMQQIGTTSGSSFSDPNVLTDDVLYFYTVDEPGQ